MATITLIAAIGKNNELGKDNELIWHIPDDMKFFKEQTINKKIILGRKTLESLNGLLPKRIHLVLTHQKLEEQENLKVYNNISDLLNYLNTLDEEVMVIGGAKIYEEFLPYANKVVLTEIEATAKADAYFPKLDKTKWKKEALVTKEYNGITYHHVIYERLKHHN